MSYINELKTFDIYSLPDLDTVVMGALKLFEQSELPKIDVSMYEHPLVVGSGNAEATARILMNDRSAYFASESSFEEMLHTIPAIDGVIIISASGEKHAPIIAKTAKQLGKHVTLITNSPQSSASKELDHQHPYDEYIFPKNREPYTYNTSTYMGMLLGKTKEDASFIKTFIEENISQIDFSRVGEYDKFYLIIPPQFAGIIRMLNVKFIELFGRNIARDIETSEYVAHATTVAPSDELFISFGEENTQWGSAENRLHIPLPNTAGYVAMMAIGYYVIAQIQKQHPDYFKQNIVSYCEEVSAIFKHEIKPIVD